MNLKRRRFRLIYINKCLANVTQKNYFQKGESKDLCKVLKIKTLSIANIYSSGKALFHALK